MNEICNLAVAAGRVE